MDRREIISDDSSKIAIAVIGMSGAFPGAHNLDRFWRNLVDGRESIRQLAQDGTEEAKVNPSSGGSHWVNRSAVLENRGRFDAEFFGYTSAICKQTNSTRGKCALSRDFRPRYFPRFVVREGLAVRHDHRTACVFEAAARTGEAGGGTGRVCA